MADENSSVPTGVAETLRRARALIEDPARWIQNNYEHSAYNVNTGRLEPVAWCAIGALEKVDGPEQRMAEHTLAEAISRRPVDNWDVRDVVTRYNDRANRTHAQVLAAFDRAIKKAERAEKKERDKRWRDVAQEVAIRHKGALDMLAEYDRGVQP